MCQMLMASGGVCLNSELTKVSKKKKKKKKEMMNEMKKKLLILRGGLCEGLCGGLYEGLREGSSEGLMNMLILLKKQEKDLILKNVPKFYTFHIFQ